ncbi:hypothetical protein HDV01_006492 [Terramyces sp. JEL0728]|nr:hypothetical protein HDV01_006492 [Terramyces sp. JEL0728]
MSSGWVKVLAKSDGNAIGLIEPLAAIGTGLSGLQIGIFTIVFQIIIDIFIKSKSGDNSGDTRPTTQTRKTQPSTNSAL